MTSQMNNGFSIQAVKCPSCNGDLELPDGATSVTCPFCGSTIRVSYPADEPSGIEPDGSIRDRGTGYGLFRARVAPGWKVTGTALQGTGSSSRPYIPQVELRNRDGDVAIVAVGNAGTRRSAGFTAITAMYNGHLAGIDRANYADVPDPEQVADAAASSTAASAGVTGLQLSRQLACPSLEEKGQHAYERFQRLAQAQGGLVAHPFIGVILRVYDGVRDGQPFKVASYVELSATKDGMSLGDGLSGMADGIGNLMSGIGNLFGGAVSQSPQSPLGGQTGQSAGQASQASSQGGGVMDFFMGGGLMGKMMRDREAAQAAQMAQQPQQPQPQQPQPQQPQQQPQQKEAESPDTRVAWCSPDFAQYTSGGTIYWSVDAVVTLVAPATDFDAQFNAMFLPLVDSLELHPDVENLALQVAMQEAAQMGQATQSQLAQNQAAFQAQQAAHRQQQAAFDSYNQSISDARNARHQQFMAASHVQSAHSAPDYSEAIRGVNTYTTSDGREVELSVHADRAYENQAGDVIGTSGGFDPGANWTEIPRT